MKQQCIQIIISEMLAYRGFILSLKREIDRLQEVAANLSRNPVSAQLREKMNRYFRDTLG